MQETKTKTLTGKNIRTCKVCKTLFKARSAASQAETCSRACGHEGLKKRVTKLCVQCGAAKELPQSHADRAEYFSCSIECSLAHRNANPHLRSEAISRGAKEKWASEPEWAEKRRLGQQSKKKPKILVHKAQNAPAVRYPYFNAVGQACSVCARTVLVRPSAADKEVCCSRTCSGKQKKHFLGR